METKRATTLAGEELSEYFDGLKETLQKTIDSSGNGLQETTHRQLYEIITAEERFLHKYHKLNGVEPQLAIAPNGLLTIETLTADLETMSKLEEFKDISEKYSRDTRKASENGPAYKEITANEWEQEKKDRKKLTSKTNFKINETKGRLELTLTEEHHTQGYDEYSQKYPVLTREGTTNYRIEFGQLIPETNKEVHKTVDNSLAIRDEREPTVSNMAVAASITKDAITGTAKLSRELFNFTYQLPKYNREHDYFLDGDDYPPVGVASFGSMIVHNAWYTPLAILTGFFESNPLLATSGIFLPWIGCIAISLEQAFKNKKQKMIEEKKTKLLKAR